MSGRFLVAVSANGIGIFQLPEGRRVARSSETNASRSAVDESRRTVLGIGPLEGERVSVSGLWGGELGPSTKDGWAVALDEGEVVVTGPRGETTVLGDPHSEAVRAGFSPDGACFVFATSSEIAFFARRVASHNEPGPEQELGGSRLP